MLNRYLASPVPLEDGQATNFNLVDSSGRIVSAAAPPSPLVAGGATPITVPLAGFSNPKYIDTNVDNATGFDISECNSVILSHDSIGTATITAEQTLDPAGLTGWAQIQGKRLDSATTVMGANPTVASSLYQYPAVGARMRFRVSALTSADIVSRVLRLYDAFDVSNGTVVISGNHAAGMDSVFPTNPIGVGVRCVTANPAAMSATGDLAPWMADMIGTPVVRPHAIPEATWQYAAASGGIVNTSDVAVKAAAAAGIRNYVTSIQLCNRNAVATEFVVKDGSTVIWRTHLPANMVDSMNFIMPVPLRGSAATAVNVACITTAAQVYCNVQGYIAP